MAIKIIARGLSPKDQKYQVGCSSCKSIIEFQESDAEKCFDQRDGDYLSIKCPVCFKTINNSMNANKVTELPPPPSPRSQLPSTPTSRALGTCEGCGVRLNTLMGHKCISKCIRDRSV